MIGAESRRDNAGVPLLDTALWVFTALVALIALILGVDWLVRADTFPVRAVRFEGQFKHVTQVELESAVMDAVRASFLRVDLDAVKERAERVPWVQSASVRRAWPRDVYVQFTEQQLLARWNGDAWVNQAMQAIRVPSGELPPDAPNLEGPEGTQALVFEQYQEMSELIAASGLHLKRLTLTPRRTWRVELDDPRAPVGKTDRSVVLILDRDDTEYKIERFTRLWPELARAGRAVEQVDLRYTNGFAVRWQNGMGG
jgi:cell division protein FtsQ